MLSKRESGRGITAGDFREPHPSRTVGAQKGTLFFPNLVLGSGPHTGSVWFVPLPSRRELAAEDSPDTRHPESMPGQPLVQA